MTSNKKLVLVFAGLPGSGKDTCADYLHKKYGADIFSYTTVLNDLVGRLYLEKNRDNLIKMSECVREKFGDDILAKIIAKDIEKSPSNFIVISNARRVSDVKYASALPGYVLIKVVVDIKIRYERVHGRAQRADDHKKTFEEFEAEHQRSTELSIAELAAQATERVNNNGTPAELEKQLDALARKYLHENQN